MARCRRQAGRDDMSSDEGLQDSIERTRQAFRAAPDAPPLISRREDTPPPPPPPLTTGSASAPPGLHPFFRGLLEALPEPGNAWPQEQRDQWLETARHIFALLYTDIEGRVPNYPPASIQFDQSSRHVS
jgi:hypothetical protein